MFIKKQFKKAISCLMDGVMLLELVEPNEFMYATCSCKGVQRQPKVEYDAQRSWFTTILLFLIKLIIAGRIFQFAILN